MDTEGNTLRSEAVSHASLSIKYTVKHLDAGAAQNIRELFAGVFEREPWNDDWSDREQLRAYIQDLVGQSNSLTFGLYEGQVLVGVAMGHIKHWYTGTEYCIDELCVKTGKQGKGLGTLFVREMEAACKALGLTHIFLLTDRDVPAYKFYKKLGFDELEGNVAFAKAL